MERNNNNRFRTERRRRNLRRNIRLAKYRMSVRSVFGAFPAHEGTANADARLKKALLDAAKA